MNEIYCIDEPFFTKMYENLPIPWYKKLMNLFRIKFEFIGFTFDLRHRDLLINEKRVKVIKYLEKKDRIAGIEDVESCKPYIKLSFEATPVHFDHPLIDMKVWIGEKTIYGLGLPGRKYILFLLENSIDGEEFSSFRSLSANSYFRLNRLNLPWLDTIMKQHYTDLEAYEQANLFFNDPLGTLEVLGANIGSKRQVSSFIKVKQPEYHPQSKKVIHVGYALFIEECIGAN